MMSVLPSAHLVRVRVRVRARVRVRVRVTVRSRVLDQVADGEVLLVGRQ